MHDTFLGLNIHAWIALAFTTFMVAMWRVGAFRLVGKWLDGQADKVRAELAEAAALKAEAEDMKKQAAAAAAQAEADARTLVAEAEKEAERILARAEEDWKAQIARREKLAADRIAAEKRSAEAELRGYAADLTMRAAEDILRKRAADGALGHLTDTAIASLSSQ